MAQNHPLCNLLPDFFGGIKSNLAEKIRVNKRVCAIYPGIPGACKRARIRTSWVWPEISTRCNWQRKHLHTGWKIHHDGKWFPIGKATISWPHLAWKQWKRCGNISPKKSTHIFFMSFANPGTTSNAFEKTRFWEAVASFIEITFCWWPLGPFQQVKCRRLARLPPLHQPLAFDGHLPQKQIF